MMSESGTDQERDGYKPSEKVGRSGRDDERKRLSGDPRQAKMMVAGRKRARANER